MNNKKLSKQEIQKEINRIFLKNPNPKEIKKAKRLAMSKNIKLGDLRKKFCKKCFTLFKNNNYSVKINKGFKTIRCKTCNYISRYKIK
jgi:RNase P subunit RPR2